MWSILASFAGAVNSNGHNVHGNRDGCVGNLRCGSSRCGAASGSLRGCCWRCGWSSGSLGRCAWCPPWRSCCRRFVWNVLVRRLRDWNASGARVNSRDHERWCWSDRGWRSLAVVAWWCGSVQTSQRSVDCAQQRERLGTAAVGEVVQVDGPGGHPAVPGVDDVFRFLVDVGDVIEPNPLSRVGCVRSRFARRVFAFRPSGPTQAVADFAVRQHAGLVRDISGLSWAVGWAVESLAGSVGGEWEWLAVERNSQDQLLLARSKLHQKLHRVVRVVLRILVALVTVKRATKVKKIWVEIRFGSKFSLPDMTRHRLPTAMVVVAHHSHEVNGIR